MFRGKRIGRTHVHTHTHTQQPRDQTAARTKHLGLIAGLQCNLPSTNAQTSRTFAPTHYRLNCERVSRSISTLQHYIHRHVHRHRHVHVLVLVHLHIYSSSGYITPQHVPNPPSRSPAPSSRSNSLPPPLVSITSDPAQATLQHPSSLAFPPYLYHSPSHSHLIHSLNVSISLPRPIRKPCTRHGGSA